MNEGQEYSSSKNPMMIVAWVLVVGALVWAIIASTMAAKRGSELAVAKQEAEKAKTDLEQAQMGFAAKEADLERKAQEAEQVRKIAMDWKNQYQAKIQELEKEKTKAAKPAPAAGNAQKDKKGAAATGKSATGSKTVKKSSKVVKSSAKPKTAAYR